MNTAATETVSPAQAHLAPDDNTLNDPTRITPLVLGANNLTTLTDKVCGIVERPRPPRAWYIAFGVSTP